MIQNQVSAGSPEVPHIPTVIAPRKDSRFEFESFNPRTVSREAFLAVPGEVQEFALKQLIREGNVDSLARLRPDFEIQYPISFYEQSVTRAIRDITLEQVPIAESPRFRFVETFLPSNEEARGNAIRQLEAERQRRQERPDSLFYSHEVIAGYKPGRRYRILLEDQVVLEIAEEKRVALEAKAEAERRRDYDARVAARDRRMVADIRIELTTIQGGLSGRAA